MSLPISLVAADKYVLMSPIAPQVKKLKGFAVPKTAAAELVSSWQHGRKGAWLWNMDSLYRQCAP